MSGAESAMPLLRCALHSRFGCGWMHHRIEANESSLRLPCDFMKRLTPRYYNWLLHRQRSAHRRKTRRERIVEMVTDTGVEFVKAASSAPMPRVLCFDQNGPETVAMLAQIRRRLNSRVKGTLASRRTSKHARARPHWSGHYRRFDTVEIISPAAALVLAAEYERMKRQSGFAARVIDALRWKPEVLETMWDVGFFDIVGIPQNLEKPDLQAEFAILPMRSGGSLLARLRHGRASSLHDYH